jgi:hypothetical protein
MSGQKQNTYAGTSSNCLTDLLYKTELKESIYKYQKCVNAEYLKISNPSYLSLQWYSGNTWNWKYI